MNQPIQDSAFLCPNQLTTEDLVNAHNNRLKDGTDKDYEENKIGAGDPWKNLDKIINFVKKWMGHVAVGRNHENIEQKLIELKIEFDYLSDLKLETLEFCEGNIKAIRKIFEEISSIKLYSPKRKCNLGGVGASKFMHAINPNLFPMWDNGIAEEYGCFINTQGYINYLKLMQIMALNISEKDRERFCSGTNGRTLPKLLDEYNWDKFSTAKMKSA